MDADRADVWDTAEMLRILIIGYGNPLRGDDGIGWRAAQTLSEQIQSPEVRVVVCHQLTPELAQDVSGAETVIFVDAARDLPPGKIRCAPVVAAGETEPSPPVSYSHHVSPLSILNVCRELYSAEPGAFLVSVGGERFGVVGGLSATGTKALKEVIECVQNFISTGQFNVP
jgi:hydrogenase maturation protease